MEKTQLEIGDLICQKHHGKMLRILKIDRVSPTQAFVDDYALKLRRTVSNGWITQVARPDWSTTSYYLATKQDQEELELRTFKVKMKARFEAVFPILTMKDCEALMDILNAIQ